MKVKDLVLKVPTVKPRDLAGQAAKAKREAIPKMVYPGVKVSMLQDWQRKLGPAIRKLGYTPDMAGLAG